MHFTNLDFLLNTRQFERAGVALITIRKALRQRYHEMILAKNAESSGFRSPRAAKSDCAETYLTAACDSTS